MYDEMSLRQEMCAIGHALYQRKYIVGTDGNLSVRLPGNVLLCTPSGICKGELTWDSFVKIDMNGKKIVGQGTPSSEIFMHLMAYKERSDVRAVVHTHPLATVALSLSGKKLDKILLAEVPIHLGSIEQSPYATPGTQDLARSIQPFLAKSDAVVMERHGLITVGKTLAEAYYKVEWVEYAAEVAFRAEQMGNILPLDEKEIALLRKK